ncbi:response regulator [Neolewinella agarilytica]|uniref:Two-component system, unclassified family, response regulator n=1 Tax=Neolewinella agarilytica TaxID=478744 RepID=A0A1H9KE40_9BACT|nr:response regulator [Neolewinella agarilytica]SEQ97420.1 two-component system, unclassified family, response regulator [Neolewinella agarilytica]
MTPHRVLLIEDDPLEAALAKRTLRQIDKSIDVVFLRDGAHFLQFYQKNHPVKGISLAIMDLHMPRVDGFGVLQKLQDAGQRAPFPIVMFSSSEDQEEIDQAYSLGASAFVRKPTAPKAYRAAMEHIVNFWLTTNRR